MNDIVRHIMFTGRDENLLARNFISPVRLGHSLCFQQAQICAAMRLSEVHGACPFTRRHFWKVSVFLLL